MNSNFFEIKERETDPGKPARYVLKFNIARIREYAPVIFGGIVLFIPSLFLLPLTSSVPPLQMCRETLLCASGRSPWGAVTSLFVYDSWTNALSYYVMVVFLAVIQFPLSYKEKWNRQIFLVAIMFTVAIFVNLLWLTLAPKSASFGSSGVVYAAWGVLVGFSFFNGFSIDPENKRLNLFSRNRIRRAWGVVNMITLVFFIMYLTLGTSLFLSEGFGINVFVHAFGFFGGFISTYIFRFFNRSNAFGNTRQSDLLKDISKEEVKND